MSLAQYGSDATVPREPNLWARAMYRLAEGVVAVCGGVLESRILSVSVPEGGSEAWLRTLHRLREALDDARISVRVQETTLTRAEVSDLDDPPPLSSGVSTVALYECFVSPRLYHRASVLAMEALGRIEKQELLSAAQRGKGPET